MKTKITKVTLLIRKMHTDQVTVYTALPGPFVKNNVGSENLTLMFEAPKGTGLKYLKENFKQYVDEVLLIDGDSGWTFKEKL